MSLINKEISDFTVQAYQNGGFHTVSKADALGHWSLFFFYPADFTFVCPTEPRGAGRELRRLQGRGLRGLLRELRHPLRAQGVA